MAVLNGFNSVEHVLRTQTSKGDYVRKLTKSWEAVGHRGRAGIFFFKDKPTKRTLLNLVPF